MNDAVNFLNDELDRHISLFSKKASYNKSVAFYFKLFTGALSFAATVILGIKIDENPEVIKNAAFVCTAAVSFVTSIDMYFNHKGLWVKYTDVRNELLSIQSELKLLTLLNSSPSEIEIKNIAEKIRLSLNKTNQWWSSERQKKSA